MKRIVTVAIWAAFAGLLLSGTMAQAQTASPELRVATATKPARHGCVRAAPAAAAAGADLSAEEWAPDVYPRYNPGPNAVRDCSAHYVQEYRPSGTVITPRMNCYWRPG